MATERFNLSIEFAGMCLFVRDPAQSKRAMHVLLPRVPGHVARLFFRPENNRSSARNSREQWKDKSLRDISIDLSALRSGASSGQQMHGHIVDLSDSLGKKQVPRRHLQGSLPSEEVLARVLLNDGAMGPINPGIEWKFGKGRRLMAISGVWTISNAEAEVPLVIPVEDGTVELHPHEGKLDLAIFNSHPDERPDSNFQAQLPTGPVAHFRHFYTLFDGVGDDKKTIPEEPRKPSSGWAEVLDATRGRRFTCIMAQAEAEPGE